MITVQPSASQSNKNTLCQQKHCDGETLHFALLGYEAQLFLDSLGENKRIH